MISIRIENFSALADCQSQLYSSKEGFMPLTYRFLQGKVYGLVSDFGCGGWALSSCLGGWCESKIQGNIYLNDTAVSCKDLRKQSCFVAETEIDGICSGQERLSVAECIQKALNISKLSVSAEEIRKLFGLSSERFYRDIGAISGEIFPASIAIGFALKKDIFCYPWMNTHDIARHLDSKVLNVLRENNKIVLLPTCRAFLKTPSKKHVDYIINFHAYGKKYYAIDPAERRQLKRMAGW